MSGVRRALALLEANVSAAVADPRADGSRVSVGVPELDAMLNGGLMPHRPYLIVGPAGTGKTTLVLQFLCEGARRGERGLFVTLEDPPNEVRWNHRSLRPLLDSVDVFDAIPDVMRYERVPFKDISSVREVVPFGKVPDRIRQTPEFTSVEVTGTALEQMLRSEVLKHGYTRLVIDSLTALQYFCMKGFDPVVGAQTFLRFLTELRTTTLLTVESPLEEVESPERMLARGEIRLFRWELDGVTVRAIGVEKLRGSSHDIRLHPYRIGPGGIAIELAQTISRDTRRIVEPAFEVALRRGGIVPPVEPEPAMPIVEVSSGETLSEEIRDLLTVGVDLTPLRSEVAAALNAVEGGRSAEVEARLARISALAVSLGPLEPRFPGAPPPTDETVAQALRRVADRGERVRAGVPPTRLPSADLLARDLRTVLGMIPSPAPPVARIAVPPGRPGAPAVGPRPSLPPSPGPGAGGPGRLSDAERPSTRTGAQPTSSRIAVEPGTEASPGEQGQPAPAVSGEVEPLRPGSAERGAPVAGVPSGEAGWEASATASTEAPRGTSTVPGPATEPAPPSPSALAVARAAALMGEPTSVPTPAEPIARETTLPVAGSVPAPEEEPRRAGGEPRAPSRRRPARPGGPPSLGEPPPLPRVAPLLGVPPGAAPTGTAPSPVAASAIVPSPTRMDAATGTATPVAAPPSSPRPASPGGRRPRKRASARPPPSPGPAPPGEVPGGGAATQGPVPAGKPRRRAVRQKKAPPVVSAAVEAPPKEESPPAPAAAPAPPAERTTPPEDR